jgi:hypothetical protein
VSCFLPTNFSQAENVCVQVDTPELFCYYCARTMPPKCSDMKRTLSHSVGVTRINASLGDIRTDQIGSILLRRREQDIPCRIHDDLQVGKELGDVRKEHRGQCDVQGFVALLGLAEMIATTGCKSKQK